MKTEFWRITLDTNPEDCNLQCIMCEENSPYSKFRDQLFMETGLRRRIMPLEWIEPILQQSAKLGVVEVIPTTMGDPLVSNHIELIAKIAPKLGMKLNITHNGTFPHKSAREWANLIVPITSDIKISWNGGTAITAERIMKGFDFNKAVQDVREFISVRDEWFAATGEYCSVTFQLTFLKSNMHELEGIIQLAASLGVDRIKGHHVWMHFPALVYESFKSDAQGILQWNTIVGKAINWIEKYPGKNEKSIRLEGFYKLSYLPAEKIPDHFDCPFLGKELWVSALGDVSPCCAPNEQRKTLGNFGNISLKSLKEIVEGENYLHLLNNYKQEKLCKKCNMRKPAADSCS